jgi:hypothetical protein
MDPQDHDQRLKILLQEFFDLFFALFWPDRARLFDFEQVTWLETEAFPDPPQGRRRALDLVARIPLKQPVRSDDGEPIEDLVAIIHVEIESADRVKPLRQTMFQYFAHLRQKYSEPILPVALYLRVGGDGIGKDCYVESFGDLEVVRYNYLYVGLPALDGEKYLRGENPLGVALSALMKLPAQRRVAIRAEAIKRIMAEGENEFRTYLLAEFVQAYLPLNESEQKEFNQLLQTDEYQEVREMATTWYEQGLEKGMETARKMASTWFEQGVEKGMEKAREEASTWFEQGVEKGREEASTYYEQGQRALAARVLERRFGPLGPEVRSRVDQWPEDRLDDLIDYAYRVDSPDDLPLSPNGETA